VWGARTFFERGLARLGDARDELVERDALLVFDPRHHRAQRLRNRDDPTT
jgi:hypothetical protein